MDSWLKVLVATACLVIIGGGAYLGWGEYQARAQAKIEQERAAENARCKRVFAAYMKPGGATVDNQQKAADCLMKGAVTREEVGMP